MSRRRRRWLIVATVVAALTITCGLAARVFDRTQGIYYYRSVDADTIRVGVTTGDLTWTRVAEVDETASSVRITVKSLSPPLPMASIGHDVELTVNLDRPLAGRTVVDGNGDQVAPQR